MLVTLMHLAVILIIGIAGAVCSGAPFVLLAVTGILLILVTAESLVPEEDSKKRNLLRSVIAVAVTAMAVVIGEWWAFFAFACIEGLSIATLAVAAPVCYILSVCVRRYPLIASRDVAEMLLFSAIIAGGIVVICLLKKLSDEVKRRNDIARERLLRTSISEMNEKRINKELAKQNYETDRNARLLERENISRNIHNSVGHSITAAIMTLDAADMLYDTKPEEARRRMNDANERIRGSLDSIRSAVRALDAEGGELPIADLRRYLKNAAEDFTMDTERSVDFIEDSYAEEISLPREHVEFLTGVLQEAFTNGVKHGGASHFTVGLTADSGHVKLIIKDDGKSDFGGAIPAERMEAGFGLRKILDYAKRCGGSAHFEHNDGFRTEVELPL